MYYPLSQIVSNLYTSNGEFVLKSNSSPYTGYYWKNSKDQFFTGKTPQDLPTVELIKVQLALDTFGDQVDTIIINNKPLVVIDNFLEENDIYTKLKKIDVSQEIYAPMYMPNLPTIKDYQIGEFRRCFCKKTNELLYLEINTETYNKLVTKDPTIQSQYYQPFNIPWQLTGNKEQVYTTNKNITELAMKQRKLPQFDKYLKENYTKYYK
jgi:hypothetical protein